MAAPMSSRLRPGHTGVMNAELDHRFSDADATAVPWDEVRRLLADAQLAWITTVRADGRPHVTPLVAAWLDDALHFCTGPDEQKAHNLVANPNVVVTTGCNRWDEGLDVMVEGEAARVTDPPILERLAARGPTSGMGAGPSVSPTAASPTTATSTTARCMCTPCAPARSWPSARVRSARRATRDVRGASSAGISDLGAATPRGRALPDRPWCCRRDRCARSSRAAA